VLARGAVHELVNDVPVIPLAKLTDLAKLVLVILPLSLVLTRTYRATFTMGARASDARSHAIQEDSTRTWDPSILINSEETTDDSKCHCCYRLWNPSDIPLGGVSGVGVCLEARQTLLGLVLVGVVVWMIRTGPPFADAVFLIAF
jgi:hypothetical protein